QLVLVAPVLDVAAAGQSGKAILDFTALLVWPRSRQWNPFSRACHRARRNTSIAQLLRQDTWLLATRLQRQGMVLIVDLRFRPQLLQWAIPSLDATGRAWRILHAVLQPIALEPQPLLGIGEVRLGDRTALRLGSVERQ